MYLRFQLFQRNTAFPMLSIEKLTHSGFCETYLINVQYPCTRTVRKSYANRTQIVRKSYAKKTLSCANRTQIVRKSYANRTQKNTFRARIVRKSYANRTPKILRTVCAQFARENIVRLSDISIQEGLVIGWTRLDKKSIML